MRKEWFEFVRKTRVKLQRKDKSKKITHQTAMAEASKLWAKEKEKILRKRKREQKKLDREAKKQKTESEDKTSD